MRRPTRRSPHTRRGGRAAGFSLIEILFALTFLAVGILAVATMIPAGTRGVTQSRVLTSGLMAAQKKLEDLKGTTFSSLAVGTFSDSTSYYKRTWTVTDSFPMAGCKKILVTVNWKDSHGTQSTQLVSYVTR